MREAKSPFRKLISFSVTSRHCDHLWVGPHSGGATYGGRNGALCHGRIEQRRLRTSDVLADYSDWPGLAQVCQLERQVIIKKTGEVREEVVEGVTSLAPERADAARLLTLVLGHWQIANQSHWVCDVTFDEDRSQVRCGSIPQVMAAFRNTVIGLMRWASYTNIALPAAGLRPSQS